MSSGSVHSISDSHSSGSESEGSYAFETGELRGRSFSDESKCCFCGSKKTIFIIMIIGGGALAVLSGVALLGALLPNATSLAAINNCIIHASTVLGSTPVTLTAFAFTVTGTVAVVGIAGFAIQNYLENRAEKLK